MKIDERNLLIEKAKARKDGVYSHKGNLYVVKSKKLIAFADFMGYCYSCIGGFNVQIGKVEPYDRKKALTEHLKAQ